MFFTLKQTSLTDDSFSFKTVAPPFSKKHEGRLAKVACANCRISKLKCTGEPNGCRRCLAKKIECQYPSSPRNVLARKQTRPGSSQARLSPMPTDGPADDDFITVASDQETTYSSRMQDLGHDFDTSGFITFENTNALDVDYADFTSAAGTGGTPWNDIPELQYINFSTGCEPSPELSSLGTSTGADPSCSCLTQAVSTHEAIEVAAWGQKELPNEADDILQHQKKALAECEGLLGCQKCSTQPAYIMLLLSMCSKILGTLEDISRHPMTGSETTTNPERGFERTKRMKNGNESGDENENGRRGYGIRMRMRQLDDDDAYHVLQSLVTTRVARLDRLLGRLDEVVRRQSWPAHTDLMGELKSRLTACRLP